MCNEDKKDLKKDLGKISKTEKLLQIKSKT